MKNRFPLFRAALICAALFVAGFAYCTAASENPRDAGKHTVGLLFAEPLGDPSENLLVTWASSSKDATTAEYRVGGSGEWRRVASHRTRLFPGLTDLWLHTAAVKNLPPDTVVAFRIPGADFTDTVRTARREGVRLGVASDYQRRVFGENTPLSKFGRFFSSEECDLLVFAGDFVDDNGISDTKTAQHWLGFLRALTKDWRRDGSQVPVLGVIGNHEAMDRAKPEYKGGSLYGGNGLAGPITEILSFGFDPQAPDYVDRGLWACGIGDELLIVSLETDHSVPLPEQADWLKAQLDAGAERYRHMIVVGHAPAFYVSAPRWQVVDTQARTLRNRMWPIMQAHAGKVRGYFCGHEHRLTATERLRMEPDATLPAEENDLRWRRDATGGVRQIGSGMIGGGTNGLNSSLVQQKSSLDGSGAMLMALGRDRKSGEIDAYGPVMLDGEEDTFNMWIADFSKSGFRARSLGHNGHMFFVINEPVPPAQ